MKTRRKSKAAAAEDAPADAGTAATLTIDVPDDVDLDVLDNLGISDATTVSPETVLSLYKALSNQSHELAEVQGQLEEVRADAERKEVDVEQEFANRDNSIAELETKLQRVTDELTDCKKEREEVKRRNEELSERVRHLENASTVSGDMKQALEDVEREKRDLVSVVSRLKEDNNRKDEEIQSLRTNLKETRDGQSQIQSELRQLQASGTASKFKTDSLEQQLNLTKAELERTTNELSAKTAEYANQRRTAHADLITVQSSLDTITQKHSALETTHRNLQSVNNSLQNQLNDALAAKQDMSIQLAEKEASFASEVGLLKRLVESLEAKETYHKELVESIEREWATVGDKAEEREAKLRQEAERYKAAKEAAEKRAEQLEVVVEKMNRGELATRATEEGMMSLSPTVAIASKVQKAGKTFTQVYAEYVQLQEDIARKSQEYDNMERTLNAVLAQIEERAPILSQQRAEYERLQVESKSLAKELAGVIKSRDACQSELRSAKNQLSAAKKEIDLQNSALEDLSRQLQFTMRELARRDDPMLPAEDDLPPPPPSSTVDGVISNTLVLFASLPALQEQNLKLLKLTRDLSHKLESEEREWKEEIANEQELAVQEAHEAMLEMEERMEVQKKYWERVIQGYVKERETLKTMVERLKAGVSLPEGEGGEMTLANGGAREDTLAAELAETKMQFEAYKNEIGVDSSKLRSEAVTATREVSGLQVELAKANAKIEYLTERQRSSADQQNHLRSELESLTHRHSTLHESNTRLEIQLQSLSATLTQSQSDLSISQNAFVNLRAEHQLCSSIQSRLEEENRRLGVERSHLSELVGNVQRMHNEIERSGEEAKRRLEREVEDIGKREKEVKGVLEKEREERRRERVEWEVERSEGRGKIEKLTADLSKTRESLVQAETSKKHLDERVEDLVRQLKGAEEKLTVYERGVRPAISSSSTSATAAAEGGAEPPEVELAELRSQLKILQLDLANARAAAAQFKEISQASETALADLHTTHDEYKRDTDAQISRYESEISALRDRVAGLQTQLAALETENAELRRKHEEEKTAWASDRKMLEGTIADLGSVEGNWTQEKREREDEVRRAEERAKSAESRYQHEVLLHADSIKELDKLKKDLEVARTAARENQATAETAKANLANSESSWEKQKEALAKEAEEMKKRFEEVTEQNSVLHKHLENVSKQAQRIQSAASSSASTVAAGEANAEGAAGEDERTADLRSVVSYLRKAKDVADLQVELNKQENVRLKAQVEHLTQSLEDVRKTLSEERARAVENATSSQQHEELLERVNQLNILRESNATLRADAENYAKQARLLEARLKDLEAQVEPAKEEARLIKAELEARTRQVGELEKKNGEWQERNAYLLTKYDRIDPAEVQALKNEIEELKESKAALETSIAQQLADKDAKHSEAIQKVKDVGRRNNETFKRRMESTATEKAELVADRDALKAKVETLELEIQTLKNNASSSEAEALIASATQQTNQAEVGDLKAERDKLLEERDQLLTEKATWTSTAAAASLSEAGEVTGLSDAEKAELIKAREELTAKLKAEAEKAEKLAKDVQRFQASATKLAAERNTKNAELAAAKKELEAAQAAASSTSTDGAPSAELLKKHADELRTQAGALAKKHQAELKAAVDAAVAEARQSTVAAEGSVDQAAAIKAAVDQKVKEIEAKHATEIEEAVERGRAEVAAKGKIKDAQLVRVKNQAAAYEKYASELKAHVPEEILATITPPPGPKPTPVPATPKATTAAGAPTATPGAGPSTPAAAVPPPVRKQSLTTPKAAAAAPAAASAAPATRAATAAQPPTAGAGRGAAGRGRGARGAAAGGAVTTPGVARGAMQAIRGAAAGGPGRGGAAGGAGRGAPATPAKQGPTSGGVQMSIMGAAGAKRPREDGDQGPDLAKRLRPAGEGAPTTAAAKPVAIKRPPTQQGS